MGTVLNLGKSAKKALEELQALSKEISRYEGNVDGFAVPAMIEQKDWPRWIQKVSEVKTHYESLFSQLEKDSPKRSYCLNIIEKTEQILLFAIQ